MVGENRDSLYTTGPLVNLNQKMMDDGSRDGGSADQLQIISETHFAAGSSQKFVQQMMASTIQSSPAARNLAMNTVKILESSQSFQLLVELFDASLVAKTSHNFAKEKEKELFLIMWTNGFLETRDIVCKIRIEALL